MSNETRTFTTSRVHTTRRGGWKVSSDTKTIQTMPNGDKKVIHHDSPRQFKVFLYHLHYQPVEADFETLEEALAWNK